MSAASSSTQALASSWSARQRPLRRCRSCEARNERVIGGWKPQLPEFLPCDPAQLLADLRPRLAIDLAHEEVQLDRLLDVIVRHREDLLADPARHREFLAQFPFQASGERFAACAFAARKLPVALEVDA